MTLRECLIIAGLVLSLLGPAPWAAAFGASPCRQSLSACPARGCATAGSADAKINEAKRRVPPAGPVRRLTLDDFATLQRLAGEKVGENKSIPDRSVLKDFETSAGKVAEGALVQITGFVIGRPQRPSANKGESVNCRLTGQE